MRAALVIFFILNIVFQAALAQNKARVVNADTEIYSEADFDSTILGTIDPDQSFLVSKKIYGAFYKIKLKDGTIGYIPDTDLYVEGVGTVTPKPYKGDVIDNPKNSEKSIKPTVDPDEDTENPNIIYKGVTFNIINFREDTMGGDQISDLPTFGFRYQPMPGNYQSGLTYDIMISPKAPDYYANKTGAEASGAVFWGSASISNVSALNGMTSLRYGAGPMLRYSYFTVQNPDLQPGRKYNLQDLTVGLDFQAGIMLHSRHFTIDLGLRYFWDKVPYGGFGVGFLF